MIVQIWYNNLTFFLKKKKNHMAGVLYVVATPIGNLEDITLRAISILSEVDIVLAEDTRVTKKLLDFIFSRSQAINHRPQLVSYHQHSNEEKKLEILNYLLEGKNIALVTDAGTPGISDPGNELIGFLLSYKPDLKIVPIPGASALATALSVCGFDVSKFIFVGYWPKKKVSRVISYLTASKMPFVFFESPHRIVKTLETLEKAFGGGIRIFAARELTKLYETHYRGSIGQVLRQLKKERIRGELTVVVEV